MKPLSELPKYIKHFIFGTSCVAANFLFCAVVINADNDIEAIRYRVRGYDKQHMEEKMQHRYNVNDTFDSLYYNIGTIGREIAYKIPY